MTVAWIYIVMSTPSAWQTLVTAWNIVGANQAMSATDMCARLLVRMRGFLVSTKRIDCMLDTTQFVYIQNTFCLMQKMYLQRKILLVHSSCHFADNFFQIHFLEKKSFELWFKVAWNLFLRHSSNDPNNCLHQIMYTASHCRKQWWPIPVTHICVNRPHGVKRKMLQ